MIDCSTKTEVLMELSLEKQHSIEWDLGRDLTDDEIFAIGAYLSDEPMLEDNDYLIELFGLRKVAA